MGDRLVAKWGIREVENLRKERRSLRRWLHGRIRNADTLALVYRQDGAMHTAAKQDGRSEAFMAVLLVLDADVRTRKRTGK